MITDQQELDSTISRMSPVADSRRKIPIRSLTL